MTTIIGGKLMQVDKSALRNVVRHTDTHNRIREVDEMWKQHEKQRSGEISDEKYERDQRRSRKNDRYSHGQMYSDVIGSGRKAEAPKKAGYWTKKLMDYEEKDPDRWGHSGFKELYPEDFGASSEQVEKRSEEEEEAKSENSGEEDIVEKWKKGRFRPKVENRRRGGDFVRGRFRRRGERGSFGGSYRRDYSNRTYQEQNRLGGGRRVTRRSKSRDSDEPMRKRLPGRFDRRSRSGSKESLGNVENRVLSKVVDQSQSKEERQENEETNEEERKRRPSESEMRFKTEQISTEKERLQRDTRLIKEGNVERKGNDSRDKNRGKRRPRWDQKEKGNVASDEEVNSNMGSRKEKQDLSATEMLRANPIKGRWFMSGSSDENSIDDQSKANDRDHKSEKILEKNENAMETSVEHQTEKVDEFGRDVSARFEYMIKKKAAEDELPDRMGKRMEAKEAKKNLGLEVVEKSLSQRAKEADIDSEVSANVKGHEKSKKKKKRRKKEKKKKERRREKRRKDSLTDEDIDAITSNAKFGDDPNWVSENIDIKGYNNHSTRLKEGEHDTGRFQTYSNYSEQEGVSKEDSSIRRNVESEMRERIKLKLKHRMANFTDESVPSKPTIFGASSDEADASKEVVDQQRGDQERYLTKSKQRRNNDSNDSSQIEIENTREADKIKRDRHNSLSDLLNEDKSKDNRRDTHGKEKRQVSERREKEPINSSADENKTVKEIKNDLRRSMSDQPGELHKRVREERSKAKWKKDTSYSSDSSSSDSEKEETKRSTRYGRTDEKKNRQGKHYDVKNRRKPVKNSAFSEGSSVSDDDEVYKKAGSRRAPERGIPIGEAGDRDHRERRGGSDGFSSDAGTDKKSTRKSMRKTRAQKKKGGDKIRREPSDSSDYEDTHFKGRSSYSARKSERKTQTSDLSSTDREKSPKRKRDIRIADDSESDYRDTKKRGRKRPSAVSDIRGKNKRIESQETVDYHSGSSDAEGKKAVKRRGSFEKEKEKRKRRSSYSDKNSSDDDLMEKRKQDKGLRKMRHRENCPETSDESTSNDFDDDHEKRIRRSRNADVKGKENYKIKNRGGRSEGTSEENEEVPYDRVGKKLTKEPKRVKKGNSLKDGEKSRGGRYSEGSPDEDYEVRASKRREKRAIEKGRNREEVDEEDSAPDDKRKMTRGQRKLKESRAGCESVEGREKALKYSVQHRHKDERSDDEMFEINKKSAKRVYLQDGDFQVEREPKVKETSRDIALESSKHSSRGRGLKDEGVGQDYNSSQVWLQDGSGQRKEMVKNSENRYVLTGSKKRGGDSSSSDVSLYGDIDMDTLTGQNLTAKASRSDLRTHVRRSRERRRDVSSSSYSSEDNSKYSKDDRKWKRKGRNKQRSFSRSKSPSSERTKWKGSSRVSHERKSTRKRRRSISSKSSSESDSYRRKRAGSRSSVPRRSRRNGAPPHRSLSRSSWSSSSDSVDRSEEKKDRRLRKDRRTRSRKYSSSSESSSSVRDRKKRRRK